MDPSSIVLVEYTRGKLYLGVIDASGITYSKNTIGSYRKDGNKFKIAFKKSLRENSEGWELVEKKSASNYRGKKKGGGPRGARRLPTHKGGVLPS